VFGRNMPAVDGATNSVGVESTLDWGPSSLLARAEFIHKTGHDLALGAAEEDTVFPVGALAAGYVWSFGPFAGVSPGIGVRGAINFVPAGLQPFYGTPTAVGGMVFIRLRPAEMSHGSGHQHPAETTP
jgi:hypothetical protein